METKGGTMTKTEGSVSERYRIETRHYPTDGGRVVAMEVAVNPAGHYIGPPSVARVLCDDWCIRPELAPSASYDDDQPRTCSIGKSDRDGKWYGWSHRAMTGFGIGDVVKEGDCAASSGSTAEYLAEHPEADVSVPVGFRCWTEADCRRAAIAYADSVG